MQTLRGLTAHRADDETTIRNRHLTGNDNRRSDTEQSLRASPLVRHGRDAVSKEVFLQEILTAYAITFGWAIIGSISMGLGIIIAVKMFEMSTHRVDEWELIKQNNIAMAIILASVIVSVGIVIAAAIQP